MSDNEIRVKSELGENGSDTTKGVGKESVPLDDRIVTHRITANEVKESGNIESREVSTVCLSLSPFP